MEKKEKKDHVKDKEALTLRKVCFELYGGDNQLCEAVDFTVSPNPATLIKTSLNHYLEMAKKHEEGTDKKPRIAAAHYWNAGRVAMYEGNLDMARECFAKYTELNPKSTFAEHFKFFNKKENAEKAMKVAQEYYRKTKQKT